MRIRKMMVLLCVMVLLLAACSSGSNSGTKNGTNNGANTGANTGTNNVTDAGTNDSTNTGTNNATNETGETDEEEVYSTPDMDFDMGGKTVRVVSWWDMTISEDNPDNIQRKKNLDDLMAKHNFKMEYIAIDYGEYQEKVTASLLAGEPVGEIVRLGKTYTVPTLVKQDLLWPIDEYTKNVRAFNQNVTNEYYTYEGRGYGFSEGQANFVSGIFYNRTLLSQLGMKSPQDYVNEDNWNWETFTQVAKDANKDTNNDGKLDTWGLANNSLIEPALYSNETGLTKDGKQNLEDPATLEALNFVSRLGTEKVGRATEGGDWTEPSQFFRQGNTLMYVGALHEYSNTMTDMPDYELGFVPFPKGPSATNYHSGEALFQALTIPKSIENPEQLMYIWEKINDIDSMYDYPDQAWYETLFTTEEEINNAKMISQNMLILDHNTFPNLKFWDFVGELNSGVSVSTLVEKYKTTFQAAIDEVYGQ